MLGLLIALVGAEGLARWLSPIPTQHLLPLPYKYDDLRRIAARDAYIQFDRKLGWTPALQTVRKDHEVVYRTNREGMRADNEYPLEAVAGRVRIAAFGDSFTFCEAVNFADCWTSKLGQALNQAEVLNFGVPGYAPDQAWLRYARDGRKYQPCAVLIGLIPENINRMVNRFRPFYEPAGGLVLSKPRFVLKGEQLELLDNPAAEAEDLQDPAWVETMLGPDDHWYFPGMFVPNPLDGLALVRLARTGAFNRRAQDLEFTLSWSKQLARIYQDRGEAFQVTARVITRFAEEVREDGATPIVVIFGSEIEIGDRLKGREKAYAPLVEWLARESISTIDLSDRLASQARRRSLDSVIENHYSPLGNTVVAEELARQLPARIKETCIALRPTELLR